MSQFLRPDGDIGQSGDWDPEPSDTTLWDVIDESSANDADYVWHDAIAGGEWFEISLSNPGATPGSGEGIYRFRGNKIDGGKIAGINCQLREGTTVIREYTYYLTTSWALYSISVTQGLMDSISDWNNLRLRFITITGGNGKASDPAISWAEFEVPDAGVAYVPKIIMIT